MNCLMCICQCYFILVVSDKKLVDYILSQFDEIWYFSLQQLVVEVGVSQFSVVKFFQKLGFKGFLVLKLVFSEVLVSSLDLYFVLVYNYICGDDLLCLVGEKFIKDNVVVMYVLLDVNIEEMLWEVVMLLCNVW